MSRAEGLRAKWLVIAVLHGAVAEGIARAQAPARPAPRMAAFSPDGKQVAVVTGEGEQKGTLSVWDVATLRPLWARDEPRRLALGRLRARRQDAGRG